ncbi:MAG TPA: hypothetical protein VF476_19105, partial [Chitinophagaceae bacterium]
MRKLFSVLFSLLLGSTLLLAQERIIKGKVAAASDDVPLRGVSISANHDGKKTSVVSNAKGEYSITVPVGTKELV